MIETVVALLMFVNGEIREHLVQPNGMAQCLRGKRQAERQFSESVSYKCYKGKAEIELYQGRKYIKALILE
jgi:hypothetical protein|tara:strand:+ start:338 stop:550 length:213 start_codon:yes stop_codon:yes gene_type:complete